MLMIIHIGWLAFESVRHVVVSFVTVSVVEDAAPPLLHNATHSLLLMKFVIEEPRWKSLIACFPSLESQIRGQMLPIKQCNNAARLLLEKLK